MSTTFAAFDAAVSAALSAAVDGSHKLVSLIGAVDPLYEGLYADPSTRSALEDRLRNGVLPMLQQHPELFQRFSFAATLVGDGISAFFAALMDVCGEQSKRLTPAELLPMIGSLRRSKKYEEMEYLDTVFLCKLKDDDEATWGLRSKHTYEKHMAAYDQGQYPLSIALAVESGAQAILANDPVGDLFAQMNIAGLLLPKRGGWREGVALSLRICDQASALAKEMTDLVQQSRCLRVEMNALFHVVNNSVEHRGDKALIRFVLPQIEQNRIYQESKEQAWAVQYMAAAQSYLQAE